MTHRVWVQQLALSIWSPWSSEFNCLSSHPDGQLRRSCIIHIDIVFYWLLIVLKLPIFSSKITYWPTNWLKTLERFLDDHSSRKMSLQSSVPSSWSILCEKIRQLEFGGSKAVIWQIPSVKFVFDWAKSAHRFSKPIDDKYSGYWSPIFHTQP